MITLTYFSAYLLCASIIYLWTTLMMVATDGNIKEVGDLVVITLICIFFPISLIIMLLMWIHRVRRGK